jgi:hypothetical protein
VVEAWKVPVCMVRSSGKLGISTTEAAQIYD